MVPESVSPWKIVEASVQVSLTPIQVASGSAVARRAAEALAFKSVLLKYNRSLGGLVVARKGNLRFTDPPYARLIGNSAFAHVNAEATLLVFAPQEGTILTGRVDHVGPDHIGMTVLRGFHASLPLSSFLKGYVYERDYSQVRWRYAGTDPALQGEDVRIGTDIRFVVKSINSDRGLLNIRSTLDVSKEEIQSKRLGIIHAAPENRASNMHRGDERGAMDAGNDAANDISDIEWAAPLRRDSNTAPSLMNDVDAFDDDLGFANGGVEESLTKTHENSSPVRKKKRTPKSEKSSKKKKTPKSAKSARKQSKSEARETEHLSAPQTTEKNTFGETNASPGQPAEASEGISPPLSKSSKKKKRRHSKSEPAVDGFDEGSPRRKKRLSKKDAATNGTLVEPLVATNSSPNNVKSEETLEVSEIATLSEPKKKSKQKLKKKKSVDDASVKSEPVLATQEEITPALEKKSKKKRKRDCEVADGEDAATPKRSKKRKTERSKTERKEKKKSKKRRESVA